MTQALQLLAVAAVAFGLPCYGLFQGRKEREREQSRPDPRQQPLFPQPHTHTRHEDRELVAR
jgi:hypothetical protein